MPLSCVFAYCWLFLAVLVTYPLNDLTLCLSHFPLSFPPLDFYFVLLCPSPNSWLCFLFYFPPYFIPFEVLCSFFPQVLCFGSTKSLPLAPVEYRHLSLHSVLPFCVPFIRPLFNFFAHLMIWFLLVRIYFWMTNIKLLFIVALNHTCMIVLWNSHIWFLSTSTKHHYSTSSFHVLFV